jgi:hypothetical protein
MANRYWVGGTGVNTIWERAISGILDGMGMEEGFLRDTVEVVLANSKWTELPGILTDCGKFSDLIVAQLPEIIAKYVANAVSAACVYCIWNIHIHRINVA